MNNPGFLTMSHDPILVILSWVVAFFSAYAALITIIRARAGTHRQSWLWGGSVAFGFGVWAMHFTAMTAMQIGVTVGYNLAITGLSVVFIILLAYASFSVLTRSATTSFPILLVSAVLLGSGVGAMHYTGMAAMQMPARLSYDPIMFGLSVVVAVVISAVGLWLLTSNLLERVRGRDLITSAVVGSAIPFMHFAGMAAARFTPVENANAFAYVGGTTSLNLMLVVAIIIVTLPAFWASMAAPQSTKEFTAVEI